MNQTTFILEREQVVRRVAHSTHDRRRAISLALIFDKAQHGCQSSASRFGLGAEHFFAVKSKANQQCLLGPNTLRFHAKDVLRLVYQKVGWRKDTRLPRPSAGDLHYLRGAFLPRRLVARRRDYAEHHARFVQRDDPRHRLRFVIRVGQQVLPLRQFSQAGEDHAASSHCGTSITPRSSRAWKNTGLFTSGPNRRSCSM